VVILCVAIQRIDMNMRMSIKVRSTSMSTFTTQNTSMRTNAAIRSQISDGDYNEKRPWRYKFSIQRRDRACRHFMML
jgi:ribosome-associated toxin RatA of RatAB toxin-antitoxin module